MKSLQPRRLSKPTPYHPHHARPTGHFQPFPMAYAAEPAKTGTAKRPVPIIPNGGDRSKRLSARPTDFIHRSNRR